MKALFVFAAAGMVALVSCDRHDWNETKKLHESHGGEHAGEAHGAGEHAGAAEASAAAHHQETAAEHSEPAVDAATKAEHSDAKKAESSHEKSH